MLRNTVTGSRRFGVAVFSTPYVVPGGPPGPPVLGPWRPRGNAVRANVVRGSGVADLGLSRTAAGGNCFRGNRGARTIPVRLQKRSCRAAGGDRRVSRALEAPIPVMVEGAKAAIRPIPYTALPAPPPQPSWPG